MLQRTVFPQKYFTLPDLLVCLFIGTVIFGLVSIGREWRTDFHPITDIDLSAASLLYYTVLSAFRGVVAYLLSLVFTLVVGYAAAKNRQAERFIIPMLDILQSIPVLGFLPGLLIALIALFPDTNFGIELAAIIMIFTGQVWNLTFAYYASLKSIPPDLNEASTLIGLGWRARLTKLELPFAAVDLAWNSLMSMAGGWFFLVVCEASRFGDREFRLPGLGAYMAVAIAEDNRRAMVMGVIAMIGLIVVMDFLIWQPILSWVQRFRPDEAQGSGAGTPLMSQMIGKSRIIQWLQLELRRRRAHRREEVIRERQQAELKAREALQRLETKASPPAAAAPVQPAALSVSTEAARMRLLLKRLARSRRDPRFMRLAERALGALVVAFIAYGAWRLAHVLLSVPLATWLILVRNTFWTFLRVAFAILLSTVWAVPVGLWLGTNPRKLQVAQPVIQILASFPAPMLYPLVIGVFFSMGINFDWASMFLIMVGVQWYVLFNVLTGAVRVPRELRYALELMETPRWTRMRTLYFPAIFPGLVTGWMTAAGSAWNASMVAEVVTYRGNPLTTGGLGASIAAASEAGDLPTLAAGLTLMVFVVVLLNRVLWAPVYHLAQTRFRMDPS